MTLSGSLSSDSHLPNRKTQTFKHHVYLLSQSQSSFPGHTTYHFSGVYLYCHVRYLPLDMVTQDWNSTIPQSKHRSLCQPGAHLETMAATQHQLRLRNGELIIFSPGEHAHLGPYISARVDTDGILQLQLNFHARRTELKEHGKLMVHFSVGRPKENFFLDVEDLADVSTFVPPRKKTICRGINVDTEARRLWARLSSVANLQREPAVCFRVLAQFVRSRSVNTSAVRHVERLEEASYSDRQGEQDSSVTSSSDIVVDDKESSNDNLPVIRRKIKQGSMKRLRRLERETRHHARLRMPPVLTAPRPYLPSPLQTPPHQHKQTREEQFAALVSQSQRETRDLLAAQRNSADSLRRTNLTPSPPNLTPVQTPEARPALSSPYSEVRSAFPVTLSPTRVTMSNGVVGADVGY